MASKNGLQSVKLIVKKTTGFQWFITLRMVTNGNGGQLMVKKNKLFQFMVTTGGKYYMISG